MEIVYDEDELLRYMKDAVQASNESPVLLDHFLNAAVEIDVDAVSDGKEVVIGAIMQHIEQAGIHSGDSACSLPPYSLDPAQQDKMRDQVKAMAIELGVCGLMNVQLAEQDGEIYIIEVNPRASRTVPFVSKCIGTSLAKVAARCMAGTSLAEQGFTEERIPSFFSVKEAVFPFNKFPSVDPILGPEMKSTGEVMGLGDTFPEAYAKAQLGAGEKLPTSGKVFLSVRAADRKGVASIAKKLKDLGFDLLATRGTHKVITDAGIEAEIVNKVKEGRPHIIDALKNGGIDLIVNTTEGRQSIADSASIRRTALAKKVFCTTTLAGADAVCEAIKEGKNNKPQVRRLQDVHGRISA
jgi:carbamoyl-phosphate synthase large subunit